MPTSRSRSPPEPARAGAPAKVRTGHAGMPPARQFGQMKLVKMYTTLVCPSCIRAKMLLKQRGVTEIDEVRVDLHPPERDTMIRVTGRRTVPQIFIGDTHVGGYDDMMALHRAGKLQPLLSGGAA